MSSDRQDAGIESTENRETDGIVSALIAFVLWGVFPLYFVLVKAVPPNEVLVHRIIWAVPIGALIIHMRHQWPEVSAALRHRRTFLYLVMSAILITGNWLVYIVYRPVNCGPATFTIGISNLVGGQVATINVSNANPSANTGSADIK